MNSTIRVRAVDKAGNEYIATLIPDPSLRSITFSPPTLVFTVIGLVLIVAFGFFTYSLSRRRRPASAISNTESSEQTYE